MHRLIGCLFLFCFVGAPSVWSQKRLSIRLVTATGVSYFRGDGSADKTALYRNALPFPNAVDTVNRPFGRQSVPLFTGGLSVEIKLIGGLFLSTDLLYENSGGSLTIDSVYGPGGNYKTDGQYKRKYDLISLNPQLGKRWKAGPLSLLLQAGVDYCFPLSFSDQADITTQDGKSLSIGHSGGNPELNDLRLTAGLQLRVSRWGLLVRYKHGIRDYQTSNSGPVYSRLYQAGLSYRLLGK